MAARVFVLKKPASCADCGKPLEEGTKVRGYPLPNGGWKIYCFKHTGEKKSSGEQQAEASAGSPPAGNLKEVLEKLKQVEEKVDKLLALLEKQDVELEK